MEANSLPLPERLRHILRERGRMPAGELLDAMQVSRPSLARAVAATPEVIRLGKARSSQYALRHEIRGESRWPLYRLSAAARVEPLGTLVALAHGEFALQTDGHRPALLHPPFEQGIYPDVPWFLDDLRPSGFLGRTYAHRVARELRVPADLKVWNAEHVIAALLHGGSSHAGDLILGELALEKALQALQSPPDRVRAAERAARYPAMAADVLRGEPPGSSPGGEQAKFTATVQDADAQRAVIVKFSGDEGSAAAQRWATLLRCEAMAGEVLAEHGVDTARQQVLTFGRQVFLESQRFDRSAVLGRRGFVSLAAIDAAFYGEASTPWWRFADLLERDGWLGAADALTLRRVAWFGSLIANSDMHLGNFGLVLADTLPLRVAPVYDMLPMALRPTAQGMVVAREFSVPVPAAGQHEPWHWAARAAITFWQRVQATQAIEPAVQHYARQAEHGIRQMAERF